MGIWGYKAFENDAAVDFLAELEETSRKSALLVRCFRGVKKQNANSDVEAAAICAAEVVASALDGQTSERLSLELAGWLLSRDVVERQEWARSADTAVEGVLRQSELKELWAESDDGAKWLDQLERLRGRLRAEPIATKMRGKRARGQRRKWLAGDVFRLALANGEYVWGRLYEPEHFGIYNAFSVDPAANPAGPRDFFGFFRVYRTEYRRAEMECIGQDPFEPEERNWRPFFTLEFPHFGWTRIGVDENESCMAMTAEVVGLSMSCLHTLESLKELLVNRDNVHYAHLLNPLLPDAEGKNVPQPWTAWPAIRARLVKAYGDDFENILFRKIAGYDRPTRIRFPQ